ncbi:hypothetical protein [Nostoc sp. TCL26-01]|uniref:hypothetical protein n=1 Tax=Nostoc sp. TCL26-01 TaxID=2576904 RepID=UPI0015BC1482|nr:hypothetical protein [Nostoc sp. TCL26-01]QLE54745.1 hypothetical protein FD725_04005 [Nostoc sp. TCL26-01]
MKRIIWYPLMTTVLVGVAAHIAGASPITQIVQKPEKKELAYSQLLAGIEETTKVNISSTTKEIDEKTALNLVWQLPQVQRKAREIKKLSRGTIKVAAIVDGLPTPEQPYYQVRIFEDEPDHNTTIYWFRVSKSSGVIEALDVIENKYISLEEWREQLRRRS